MPLYSSPDLVHDSQQSRDDSWSKRYSVADLETILYIVSQGISGG